MVSIFSKSGLASISISLGCHFAAADVVVPITRSYSSCISYDSQTEIAPIGRQSLEKLLRLTLPLNTSEMFQIAIVNLSTAELNRDWKKLSNLKQVIISSKPGTYVSMHLVRYESGVPWANREREVCQSNQVQVSLMHEGFVYGEIFANNPCTPGFDSYCNVACEDFTCAFKRGHPRTEP